MEISLSGLNWQVKGYWPYVPVREKSMETGQTLHGVTDWIKARVPGGVHYDLWKAGLIENPYFGKNSLLCEWVENRWWMYRASFPAVQKGCDLTGEKVSLLFHGLDYEADVFFNDEPCGSHTGMYDAFTVDLTGRIREENKIVVVFHGAPREMGQIGYTSKTSTQKSRFNYKWDFSTRLVNIGFWQDVTLYVHEAAELSDVHIDTDALDGKGKIFFSGEVSDNRMVKTGALSLRLTVRGPFDKKSGDAARLMEPDSADGRSEYEAETAAELILPVSSDRVSCVLTLDAPALWNPNGAGGQPLYQVRAELSANGQILCEKDWRTGVRSLKMEQNGGAPADALPYTFVLNGRKLYIKGVNLTPLDHLYGNVRTEQYAYLIAAMVNAGVNLVRVWGGGLIEKEEFYDLCDENGILVWQEFIQSSSGIDNKPCEDEAFLTLLKAAATAAVRQKRNHVSLSVYSGGNELMEEADRPAGLFNKNLAMLSEFVKKEDGRRPFLPTSASGPREFVTTEKGVSHDVHGSWRYEGNPRHYELYGESDNLFHSEFGMDGAAGAKSLRKFLPEKSLCPTPMSGDENWMHHGEWWGTYFRDCELFGPIGRTPGQLDRFIKCSQYVQSEGLRFILEADRRRAFQNSGTIIWQLNEPWPNASCTNLIDYYGETKSAYYQVKRAYERLHVSLDYRSLTFAAGEKASFPVYASNSGPAVHLTAVVLFRNESGRVLQREEFEFDAPENGSVRAGEAVVCVPKEPLLYATAQFFQKKKLVSENTYLFGTREKEPLSPVTARPGLVVQKKLVVTDAGDGRYKAVLTIQNEGERAVLEAGAELAGNRYWLLGDDNYVTLFPGEERTFTFLLIPVKAGSFLEEELPDEPETPEFRLRWL